MPKGIKRICTLVGHINWGQGHRPVRRKWLHDWGMGKEILFWLGNAKVIDPLNGNVWESDRGMARAYMDVPLPSTHALVRDGERFLLVQRKRPPFEGYWGLPGGGVELGETVSEALRREVREETGLDVAVGRLLGYIDAIDQDDSGRIRYHYVIMYFEAEVQGGTLTAADDAAAVRWVTLAEARSLPLTDAVERTIAWAGLEKGEHGG